MDARNPPYVPRYIKPSAPPSATFLSPRKTLNPSTEELLDAHERGEQRLKREKAAALEAARVLLERTSAPRQSSPRHTLQALLWQEEMREAARMDGLSMSSPRRHYGHHRLSSPRAPPATTKEIFARAGGHCMYPLDSMITSTLDDAQWFRLPKASRYGDLALPTVRRSVPPPPPIMPPLYAGTGAMDGTKGHTTLPVITSAASPRVNANSE